MSTQRLQLRETRLDQRNLGPVASLLRRCFPAAHHIDERFLAWQYLASPEGESRCVHAHADGRLVGHVAFSPIHARLDAVPSAGLLVHNIATDPEYRGRGILTSLLGAGLEGARASGHRFLISVPNRQSVGAFVSRHGFQALGTLEARLGLGPTPRPANDESGGFCRSWTREALRWRLNRPGALYGHSLHGDRIRLECETGTLGIRAELAWLRRSELAGVEPSSLPVLPRRPLAPTLCIGLDSRRAWGLRPYLDLPVRVRPAPLHLVFCDLGQSMQPLDRDRVRFRLLDFDVY